MHNVLNSLKRALGITTREDRLKALDNRAARRRELRLGVEAAMSEFTFAMKLAF